MSDAISQQANEGQSHSSELPSLEIAKILEKSRQSLLDLSLRNRLLNVSKQAKNAKIIHIADEISSEVYRLLVQSGKTMTFLPGKEDKSGDANEENKDDIATLPQPGDNEEIDERGIAARHSDKHLQTLLTSSGLQKRLLTMFYDAKTFEEEQGVNILYLAVGMLHWFENDTSDIERCAPLLLIPVELQRSSAAERFHLKWRGEDIASNLSLQAKMKAEFGLIIPELPQSDDLDISAYMQTIAESVKSQSRFTVHENEMMLGFFSFAKFLMYRDLDAQTWPTDASIDKHETIVSLLGDGFISSESLIGEDDFLDKHISPLDMCHVVDADSSQTLSIEEVRRGRNMVIQGPPGTGKSQTISNMVASAVAQGKKVLFIAEKMAALEVVFRRLTSVGLGPVCLELHSQKANKRNLLDELRRTMELGRPRGNDQGRAADTVDKLRSLLNQHASNLHAVNYPSALTAYQVIGRLLQIKESGIQASGVKLHEPETWTPDDFDEREFLLKDIAARIHEIGPIDLHPWYGVYRDALLPSEYERLEIMIDQLCHTFDTVENAANILEQNFPANGRNDLNSLEDTKCSVAKFLQLPKIELSILGSAMWLDRFSSIEELVKDGQRHFALKEATLPKIKPLALEIDLSVFRQSIAIYGGSFFSFVHAPYRHAKKFIASLLNSELPKLHSEQLQLVDDIIEIQKLEKKLHENTELGKTAFGYLWDGLKTDWNIAANLIEWRSGLEKELITKDYLSECASANRTEAFENAYKDIETYLSKLWAAWEEISNFLKLDIEETFSCASSPSIPREAFTSKIHAWKGNVEPISKWIALKDRLEVAKEKGLSILIERLKSSDIASDQLSVVFARAYYDALAEKLFSDFPELRAFDGDRHHQLVEQFKENDLQRIDQARIEVMGIHYNAMPRSVGGTGPLGVLNSELAKKRNHLPVRQLLKRAGPAIQAIKPVFMMSPLSVAQFLEAGALNFDLLLIDEASQIEPVDALGAIARAKQVVVVGDSRQLPPTRFFSKMTGNDSDAEEDDESYNLATQDVESILSLCLAKGLPQRMLRWHYRSKHQSLIAVSNKEFYENKLFIVPSPYDQASGMGLKFHYLPDATFDRGGTATNAKEAKAVAEAVMHHAKNNPELSLGVAAFSMKQKQAILDEVEILRRANPDVEPFFTQEHPNEPFFAKNLENIQGDERDVIFISVGYGKNPQGYMNMSFGPLNSDGGERRLNVLISRAKRRCEVFSSITADDIDLERAKGHGVAALKLFLRFAQTGQLDFSRTTGREADSAFEEQVASALRKQGYDVKNQVGIAGFFVDIAVSDPDNPGRFVIGIECDGASYHSSRSARDRDRLRQSVLEAHGWIIHRIWSTDWFQRPKEQLEKTIAAIESAKQQLLEEESYMQKKSPASRLAFEYSVVEREDVSEITISLSDKTALMYEEASFSIPANTEPHNVPDSDMADIVTKIIAVEGPVHEQEVISRVRSLWNLKRAGGRIQKKVTDALCVAKTRQAVFNDNDFYSVPGSACIVRDRSTVTSSGLRKPEYLPPMEIQQSILSIIEENFGADCNGLAVEVARRFGFQSTSPQLRGVIESQISLMIEQNQLLLTENILTVKENIAAVAK